VFRASFDIVAVIDASLTAVSNMPQSRRAPARRQEGSELREVGADVDVSGGALRRRDGSPGRQRRRNRLGIYTVKGKRERARYAMEATKQIVRYFNGYFGEAYPLVKLDQIALPGGIPGAMEKLGGDRLQRRSLPVQPGEDSLRQQQAVYGIIAHQIAHQWFGNLVTMAWWDNLWLNEGFASWMASKTTERFNPGWGMRLRDALWKETALAEDARRTTHPIQTPVETTRARWTSSIPSRTPRAPRSCACSRAISAKTFSARVCRATCARIAFPVPPRPTSGTISRRHRGKTSANWSPAGPSSRIPGRESPAAVRERRRRRNARPGALHAQRPRSRAAGVECCR